MAQNKLSDQVQLIVRPFVFSISVTVAGCAGMTTAELPWSEDLPPRAYFLLNYQQDAVNRGLENQKEYLSWVIRFYKGWSLYPKGWNEITKELLLQLKNAQTASLVKHKMEQLGLLISGEWAKNNQTRLITTYHVSVWGNALMQSLDQGDTLNLIDRVAKDINALLTRELNADAITAERYYVPEEEIAF